MSSGTSTSTAHIYGKINHVSASDRRDLRSSVCFIRDEYEHAVPKSLGRGVIQAICPIGSNTHQVQKRSLRRFATYFPAFQRAMDALEGHAAK